MKKCRIYDREKRISTLSLIVFLLSINLLIHGQEQQVLPAGSDKFVRKSVYSIEKKTYGSFYYRIWGKHYESLYYDSIQVRSVSIDSLFGGLTVYDQLPKLHSLVLDDKKENLYMLKPLGGASSFMESGFFRQIYNKDDFDNTYVGDFVRQAYTIVHPYSFLASDYLAKSSGLPSGNAQMVYIAKSSESDTIVDGTQVQDKIVSISQLPDFRTHHVITDTREMLDTLHTDNLHKVDISLYIRTRLLDMLIGDWNKIPENWAWIEYKDRDSTVYRPFVLDRNQAFTKVDGVFFKQLMNMLGVGFITDYEARLKNVKKFNKLGYPLDVALTVMTNENVWQEEAKFLKENLTDEVINKAFDLLPKEISSQDTDRLKGNLKDRRNDLENIAAHYYREVQKTPVLTGTNSEDKFVVKDDDKNGVRISVYDNTDKLIADKKFVRKQTKEIWIYGLDGNDKFDVDKKFKDIPVLLIGGKGENSYSVESGKGVSIYETEAQKQNVENISNVKVIIPSKDSALVYNYENLSHTQFSVTPIGIYDSDLGLNIGTSIAYTIYGFRRAPYTRRHQLSVNYSTGFTYQGIFPDYDSRRSFHLMAFVGSPAYFSNFFGFGNNTEGYKNKQKKYNRVNITRFTVTPGFYYEIDKSQIFNLSASLDVFKIGNPKNRNRFINEIYKDDDPIFDTKLYADISAGYEIDRKFKGFISSAKFVGKAGWTVNTLDAGKNFPYLQLDAGVNLKLTDRLTFATLLKGRALFTDKYEFFQSATTELRGFRDNRFIGKQSFYQYSDLRFDMGQLKNPLTPLGYGLFVGVDHGRVWYPDENSRKWHTSYGGGCWLTLFRNFTGKFSYFASTDTGRFQFELGMGF